MQLKLFKKKSKLLSCLTVTLSNTFILLYYCYLAVYWIRKHVLKEDLKLILCKDTVIIIRGILLIAFLGLC